VHLDQSVFVGDGAVDDEKDEVVIVVELRSLTEVLGILQGERMELKDITEYREVLLRRLGKVDPKEAAAPSQTFEVVTAEMQVANLLFMYDMTGRGIGDRLIALSVVAAVGMIVCHMNWRQT
jgi:hypothetical protein